MFPVSYRCSVTGLGLSGEHTSAQGGSKISADDASANHLITASTSLESQKYTGLHISQTNLRVFPHQNLSITYVIANFHWAFTMHQ